MYSGGEDKWNSSRGGYNDDRGYSSYSESRGNRESIEQNNYRDRHDSRYDSPQGSYSSSKNYRNDHNRPYYPKNTYRDGGNSRYTPNRDFDSPNKNYSKYPSRVDSDQPEYFHKSKSTGQYPNYSPKSSSDEYNPFETGKKEEFYAGSQGNQGSNGYNNSHRDHYQSHPNSGDRSYHRESFERAPYAGHRSSFSDRKYHDSMDVDSRTSSSKPDFSHSGYKPKRPNYERDNSEQFNRYETQSQQSSNIHQQQTGVPSNLYSSSPRDRRDNYANLRQSEPIMPAVDSSSSFSQHHSTQNQAAYNPLQSSAFVHTKSMSNGSSIDEYQSPQTLVAPKPPVIESSAEPAQTLQFNKLLANSIKESLSASTGMTSEDQHSLKTAVDSILSSLQAVESLEKERDKLQSEAQENLKKLAQSEASFAQKYYDYQLAHRKVRLIEGDMSETRRIAHELEDAIGDWPESQWNFPPPRHALQNTPGVVNYFEY